MATTSAPVIRFARSGDVDIAYQVVEDGPVDLVFSQGSLTHLQVEWELRRGLGQGQVDVCWRPPARKRAKWDAGLRRRRRGKGTT